MLETFPLFIFLPLYSSLWLCLALCFSLCLSFYLPPLSLRIHRSVCVNTASLHVSLHSFFPPFTYLFPYLSFLLSFSVFTFVSLNYDLSVYVLNQCIPKWKISSPYLPSVSTFFLCLYASLSMCVSHPTLTKSRCIHIDTVGDVSVFLASFSLCPSVSPTDCLRTISKCIRICLYLDVVLSTGRPPGKRTDRSPSSAKQLLLRRQACAKPGPYQGSTALMPWQLRLFGALSV